jgi:hypothetical protein
MRVDHTADEERVPPVVDDHPEGSFVSRRAVLKAGWSVPVIMAVAPSVAFAASGSVGGTTHSRAGGSTTTTTRKTGTGTGTGTGAGKGDYDPGSTGQQNSGVAQQQQAGPQPARTNRGFTG